MTTPERGGPGTPNEPPAPNQEPTPYRRAARLAGEQPAGEAYFGVQRVLHDATEPTDLSAYRLQLDRLWHVAAVGVVPPAVVLTAIEEILARGEPADLPDDVWQTLTDRRAQATREGPWTEGHYRPGRRL